MTERRHSTELYIKSSYARLDGVVATRSLPAQRVPGSIPPDASCHKAAL